MYLFQLIDLPMSFLIFFLQQFKFQFQIFNLVLQSVDILIFQSFSFGFVFQFVYFAIEHLRGYCFVEPLHLFVGGWGQRFNV